MDYSINSFLLAYFLTNFIEFFPLHLLIKKPFKEKLIALFLTNLITLPVVWIVLPFFYSNYWIALVSIEFLVVIAETFLLKRFLTIEADKAFIASFAMNFLSTIVGLLLP